MTPFLFAADQTAKQAAQYSFAWNPGAITSEFGLPLAMTGIAVVFTALVLVTAFIAALPKLLPTLERWFPPAEHGHGAPAPRADESEELAVAIGYALHREFQRQRVSSRS